MSQRLLTLFFVSCTTVSAWADPDDLRTHYDVEAYDLQLAVRPSTETLEGVVAVTATATEPLAYVQLDLHDLHEVVAVRDASGEPLEHERIEHGLRIRLPQRLDAGETFTVSVHYEGQPTGQGFDGFHWERSQDGHPWINTACQGLGAHYWYPCKASYFHPDDKPARVSMAITCPADLYGVSNGRLDAVEDGAPEWFDERGKSWKTYRWSHGYPLETYTVTLNVGPYVVVEDELDAPGIDQPVPFVYYVLPENAEKAALQFQEVPELVRIFSEAFGPFPFPESKFALVETNFWGMEHSTAVAYGSSYPAWCKKNGVEDAYASRNRWFDYILIHEVAHEWWGNAVSAEHWGHFWIHEGFGTYAEGVYVEGMQGREAADRYFAEQGRRIPAERGRLYRGDHPASGDAYSGIVYSKGATVLHTLRHYVNDDDAWWKTLREFNVEARYGNASTEDFQRVLERNTNGDWERFLQEWFYGIGTPTLTVAVSIDGNRIQVDTQDATSAFRVPIDLEWNEGGEARSARGWVDGNGRSFVVETDGAPTDVRVVHLDRLLGQHTVTGS